MTGMIVDRFSYAPVFVLASVMPLTGVLILFATLGDYRRVTFGSSSAARAAGE
jgi:hypothetical protein